MADAKRKLMIEILSDASGVKKGFGEAEGAAGKFGLSLGGVAKLAAGLGGTAAAVDLIKDSVGGAVADQASVEALVTQMNNMKIPKENQKSVEDMISQLSLARGVADDELRPAMAQLVRATGDVDLAFADLALAQDISAAKHISVAEAADLLAKAENGNFKGLKSLGISLKDSNGDALTTQGVFEKLTTTFNNAGYAATLTGEGKLRKMTVAFDEMKEKIGYVLLPVIEKLVTWVTEKLIPAIEKWGQWFKIHILPVLKVLADFIFQQVVPALHAIFDFLTDHKEVLIGVGVAITAMLVPAFIAWAVTAGAAAVATIAAAAPVIALGLVIAALATGVVLAVKLIIDHWTEIVDFFQALPGKVLDFLKGLPDLLLDLGKKLLGGLLDGIKWYADNVLKKFYIDLPLMILGWMLDASLWLLDVGKKILSGLLDGIIWVAENVLYQYFIGIPLKILEWVGKAELWLFDKGKDILLGVVHGLESAWSDLFTWFFNLPGRLWQLVVDGAEWLVDFGRNLVKGIVKGIKEAPGAIRDALISLVPGGGGTVDKILKYIGIPAFAEGGYVGGPVGAPQLAVVHGGEYVVSNAMQAAAGAGSVVVNNYVTVNAGMGTDGRAVGDQVAAALTNFVSRNGKLPWMAA